MSKGNLPQTEAGSSEAVAPGKAELLSFLKCQRGTGTGNTSLCALWFPPQRWQAAVLNKGNKQTTVIYYSETLYMCQESQVYNLPTDLSFSFNIKLFWILIQCGFSSTRSFFFFSFYLFSYDNLRSLFIHEAWFNTESLKSHGWTLCLKREEKLNTKEPKGIRPSFFPLFHSFVPGSLSCQEPQRKQNSLFISSKRSQEAVWLCSEIPLIPIER